MDREEFNRLCDEILAKAKEVRSSKGRDYQRANQDILSHFREGAERNGITKYQTLGVLLGKQMSAIEAFIKTGKLESEPIEMRIIDAINFLLLLNGLHIDDTKKEKKEG
jgi:hypothetical protein